MAALWDPPTKTGMAFYGSPFPGRTALRAIQALATVGVLTLTGFSSFYAFVAANAKEYNPGDDFEACIVSGGSIPSTRFAQAASGVGLNSSVFTFLAALVADRALRHPSWLLPSLALVVGMVLSEFLNADITNTVPVAEAAWATQLNMAQYVRPQMYDCLPFENCGLAAAVNMAWISALAYNDLCLLALALLLLCHYLRYRRVAASTKEATLSEALLPGNDFFRHAMLTTAPAEPRDCLGMRKVWYRAIWLLSVAMGLSMLLELSFLADASYRQLAALQDMVPLEMPPVVLINTTIEVPTCEPKRHVEERSIVFTLDQVCDLDEDLNVCGEIVGCTVFPFGKPNICPQFVLVGLTVVAAVRAFQNTSFSAFRLTQFLTFAVICTLLPFVVSYFRVFYLHDLWSKKGCREFLQSSVTVELLYFEPSDTEADHYCTDTRGAMVSHLMISGFAFLALCTARVACFDIDQSIYNANLERESRGTSTPFLESDSLIYGEGEREDQAESEGERGAASL